MTFDASKVKQWVTSKMEVIGGKFLVVCSCCHRLCDPKTMQPVKEFDIFRVKQSDLDPCQPCIDAWPRG